MGVTQGRDGIKKQPAVHKKRLLIEGRHKVRIFIAMSYILALVLAVSHAIAYMAARSLS